LDSRKNEKNHQPANPPYLDIGIHHGGLAVDPVTLICAGHHESLTEWLPTHPSAKPPEDRWLSSYN